MYKCNLKVQQMVSSQCLTLGSRNFVDCMIWKTLFKSHWISVSHIQLYEYCDLKAISTGKPVLRHWDPASHATSSKMLCFNIRLATFLLTNLMSNQIFWIPVSSTDHLLCNLPSKMNVRTAMSGCWDDKGRH